MGLEHALLGETFVWWWWFEGKNYAQLSLCLAWKSLNMQFWLCTDLPSFLLPQKFVWGIVEAILRFRGGYTHFRGGYTTFSGGYTMLTVNLVLALVQNYRLGSGFGFGLGPS